MQPHRRQPTRLPRPWGSPGKNTGVGCHFLLQCMKVKSESEVAESCPTPSNPMDCSPPGSSIHGIFQARVLEWVAIAFSIIYTYICIYLYTEIYPVLISSYFLLCQGLYPRDISSVFLNFHVLWWLWGNSEFGLMTNTGHIPITFSECSTSTLGLRGQNPIIGYCPCCMDCSWNNVDCRCTNCYLHPGGLSPLSPQLHSQGYTGCCKET